MKTNHARGFKDERSSRAVFGRYLYGYSRKTVIGDTIFTIGACATTDDHTNGKHGIARDRRGAKKFVHSRTRFHAKAAIQKILSSERLTD